jgi:hypothetical protein
MKDMEKERVKKIIDSNKNWSAKEKRNERRK